LEKRQFLALGFSRHHRKGYAVKNLAGALHAETVRYKLSIGRRSKRKFRLKRGGFAMRIMTCAACVLGLFLFPGFLKRSEAAPSPADAVKIARGEYLVKHTSMCDDCHTVHDARGTPIKSKHLQGAKIVFSPIEPMPSSAWADTAPPITGLSFFTDQEAVVFFTTSKMPDGKLARAPMPPYRFSKRDAEALIAYLKSLPAPAK
jgi:mono/diheme cytochrome c family protein